MPAVTAKDVLAAVQLLGTQLGAGQANIERRMDTLEDDVREIKKCTQGNSTDIAVLKAASAEHDNELGTLQDREREGAIKQGTLAVTLSTVVSVVMAWLYDRMRA